MYRSARAIGAVKWDGLAVWVANSVAIETKFTARPSTLPQPAATTYTSAAPPTPATGMFSRAARPTENATVVAAITDPRSIIAAPTFTVSEEAATSIWMPFVDSLGLHLPRGALVTTDAVAATETLDGALLPELVGTSQPSKDAITRVVKTTDSKRARVAAPVITYQNQQGLPPPNPPMRCFGIATGRSKRVGGLVYIQVIVEGLARAVSTSAFDPTNHQIGVPFEISGRQLSLRVMLMTRGPEPLLLILPRGRQRLHQPQAPQPATNFASGALAHAAG